MIITLEDNTVIQGSELLEAILRTSLEPVPLTFECSVRLNEKYAPYLLENKIIKVGKEQTPVKIIYAKDSVAPFNNGNLIQVRNVIALHENSAGIATALTKAVIRENVSLSEIYRSCGGKSEVGKSFTVPRFYAYAGNTPSLLISRVCQEHGGVVRWISKYNRLEFARINDLFQQEATVVKPKNSDNTLKSDFIVKQELPRYISTDEKGAVLLSQSVQGNNSVKFVPHKSQAQLNFMANVILNAKEVPCDFSPDIHAGDIADLGGVKMVVLTAAHAWHENETGVLENTSVFWLGVKNKLS